MELTIGSWRMAVERLPAQQSEIAALYDAAATRWHAALRMGGYLHAYHDLLGNLHTAGVLSHLRAGSRVLDCGIGTGAFSAAFAQAAGVPLHITGVDLSAMMLQVARNTLRGSAQEVQLHRATSAALPFSDQSFDAVISAHMLEHFADPRQGLSELVRVLRPDAPLIIAVTTPGWFDSLQQLRWRHNNHQLDALPQWMHAMGLSVHASYPLRTTRPLLAQWQSRVYVGVRT